MTSIRLVRGRPSFVFVLLCIGLLCGGCSKESGNSAATGSRALDSAPAELKAKWDATVAYAAKSDYLGAVTNLVVIFGNAQALTPEQNEALQQVWADVGNKSFQAANEGDEAALQAVMAIRASGIGKAKGER